MQTRVRGAILALVVSGCSFPLWKFTPGGSSDAGDAAVDGTTCATAKKVCFRYPEHTIVSWGVTSVTSKQASIDVTYPSVVLAAYGSSEIVELRMDVSPVEAVSQLEVDLPPWQAVAGDFELNGNQDILVASPGSPSHLGMLSMWSERSDEQWSSAMTQTVGAGTYAMTARDVPVAQEAVAITASYDAQSLLPFLAHTGAAPTVGKSLTVDLKPTAAVFGPNVGGGNQLFVVGSNAGSGRLRVFDASGENLTLAAKSQDFGSAPNDIKLGDFNGDSRLEVAVVNDSDPSALFSLAEDGSGNWQVVAKLDLPAHSHAMALADFDHDGHPDVAVVSGSTDTIEVCFGDGSSGFGNCINVPHALQEPTDIVAVDVDSDGWSDLVAVGYEGGVSSIRLVPATEQ